MGLFEGWLFGETKTRDSIKVGIRTLPLPVPKPPPPKPPPPKPPTPAELDRISELELEKEKWHIQQLLEIFKSLPSHIRLEILDEVHLRVYVKKMESINNSIFENANELYQLKSKVKHPYDDRQVSWARVNVLTQDGAVDAASYYRGAAYKNSFEKISVSKFKALMDQLTKDELIRAHMEISAEEALLN